MKTTPSLRTSRFIAAAALLSLSLPALAQLPSGFNNYLPGPTFYSVYESGGTIYGGSGSGFSFSTTNGTSWITRNFTNSGLGSNFVRGVYESGGTVYAATFGGGLSTSNNTGINWTNFSTPQGLNSSNALGVYVSGCTTYVGTDDGLSISTNRGGNWTNFTTANGLPSNVVSNVFASGGTIYAATSGGLSVSSNGGATWTNYTTANGLGGNTVWGVFASGNTIYAATQGGLSISTNGGGNWTNFTAANGLGNTDVRSVFASGSTIYVGAANGGLSISTNGGGNWTTFTAANGLGGNSVRGVYASGGTIYAATNSGLSISFSLPPSLYWLGSNGTLWSAGNNWSTDISGSPVADFAADSDIIFSATGSTNSTDTDLGGDLSIGSLTINSTAPVGISGGNLTITGSDAVTVSGTAGNVSISAPLILSGSSSTLSIENANTTLASITSANGLIKTGNGTVEIQNRIWVSELGGNLDVQSGNFVSRDGLSIGVGASNETATVSGNTTSFSSPTTLNVGYSGNGSTLTIENGASASAGSVWIGGTSPSENNRVTVNGTGSSLNSSVGGSIAVGYAGSNNSLSVSNGGSANSSTAYIGYESTANNNTATVAGPGSAWTNTGAFIVGFNGTGNALFIEDGGSVQTSADDVRIGYNVASNNNSLTVNGTGSSFAVTGSKTLYVGENGTGNTLSVTNGGNLSTFNTRIGGGASSNNNTLTVSGTGSTWNNTGSLRVGSSGSGNALHIANGGNATVLGNMFLGYSSGSANNTVTVNGTGSVLTAGNLTVGRQGTGTLAVNNGGRVIVLGGIDRGNGSTVAIEQGGTLQLGNGGAGGLLGISALQSNGTIIANSSSSYSYNGSISGTGNFIKDGTGTLTVAANQTYSGGTAVNGGTFALGASNLLLNTGNLSVGGGSFDVGAFQQIFKNVTLSSGTIIGTGGNLTAQGYTVESGLASANLAGNASLTKSTNGTATLSGSNTYNGTTSLNAGTLQIGSAGALGSGGNITFGGGTLQYGAGTTADVSSRIRNSGSAIRIDTNGDDVTFGSSINATNTAGLSKLGAGTLTLTGNNSYTGGTFIESGTLAGNSDGLKGNITNNATLLLGNYGFYQFDTTGAGTLLVAVGDNLFPDVTFYGNATMAGGTTIQSGTLTIGTTLSNTFRPGSITGNISNEGTLRFDLSSGNRTYGDSISGNGSLQTSKSGGGSATGILFLTGNNTYTGGTFISNGTVDISGGTLASTGNVSITGASSLDIGSSNQTIGQLTLDGLTAHARGNGTLAAYGVDHDLRAGTVLLNLGGNAGIVKNATGNSTGYAAGLVYLLGNNTATGNTTINGGILSFSAVQSLYGGSNASWTPDKITVGANATLALGTGGGSATQGFNNAQIAEIFRNLTQNATGTLTPTTGLTANSSIGFNVSSGANFTLNSTISDRQDGGAIGMDKIGNGVLILGATSNFTGPLNIYEGRVEAGVNNALSTNSSLLVDEKNSNNPTGYSVGNYSQQFVDVTLIRGSIGGNGTVTATGNYTMSNGNATANLSGAAPLVATGNGTVFLSGTNTYTGSTTVNGTEWSPVSNLSWKSPTANNAKLQFQNAASLYTGNNATWNSGNITVNPFGILSVRADNSGTAGFTADQIGTLITNLVTANRSTGGFLGGSALGIDISGANMTLTTQLTDSDIPGGGRIGLVKYGNGTLTLTGTNTHSLLTSITGGTLALAPGATLSSSSANVAISLGAALDIGATNQTVTSLVSAGGNILGNGTLTALAPGDGFSFIGSNVSVNLAGAGGVIVESGNPPTTTLFGNNTYTGNTTLRGGATLALANVNALSGSTLVNSGTVQLTAPGAGNTYNLGGLSGSVGIAIGNNTLSIGANGMNTTYFGNLTGTGGAITKVGNGTLSLTGNNTYTGGTTITIGTLSIGDGNATGSVTGNITNNATLAFNRSNNATYSDTISGSGNVAKLGNGALTLSGCQTYTGSTTISAGTLTLNGSLASTAITIAAGAQLYKGAAGDLSQNATIQNSGFLEIGSADTIGNLSGNGTTNLTANLTTGGLGGDTEISGSITGCQTLTKEGTGTLALTGNATNGGGFANNPAIVISNGTVSIGNGGTTGSVTGNITNNAALAFNRSNTYSYNGVVSGTGSLEQRGTGTTILVGSNTYSGGTIVTAGTLQGNTQSLQGSITNNATLVFNQTTNGTYSGALGGTGLVSKNGSGTLTLNGTSSFAGSVAINAGNLAVTGSLANSTTQINSGGTLLGSGTLGAVTINAGGTIAPGTSPGNITVGNMTWNSGGTYAWELGNATGTAGTGWDFINSTGSLTIGANSTNPFTIAASTTNASGFDPNAKSYSWKIAEFGGGITGFQSNSINITTTGFGTLPSVHIFYVSQEGKALNFNYATVATWNAGSGNWSNTANWVGGSRPVDGVAVEYAGPNGSGGNSTYDNTGGYSVADIYSLAFTSGANASYTIAGGGLAIGEGGIVNNSNSTQTVAINLALGANQTFAANTANLIVSGNLTGGYSLTKEGNQTLVLAGANSYTGPTLVSNGTVVLANRNALYSGDNSSWTADNITVGYAYGSNQGGSPLGVAAGPALVLKAGGAGQFTAGDIALLANNLVNGTASGNMTGNTGTGFASQAMLGIDTTGGNITMQEALVAGTNVFTVNGTNRTQTYSLAKLGSGTLDLAGNNTYSFGGGTGPDIGSLSSGITAVNAGTLRLGEGVGLATPVSFVGGNPGEGATFQVDGGNFLSLLSTVGLRAGELRNLDTGNQLFPTLTGEGVMNVTGGNVTSMLGMVVGGKSGQLNISGGNVTVGSELYPIGLVAGVLPGSNGTINVSGGNLAAYIISLGGISVLSTDFGGNGTLNLSAGNVTAGNMAIGVGNGSIGIVNITGGNATAGSVILGNGSASQGGLLVSGGTLLVTGQAPQPDNRTAPSPALLVGGDGIGLLSINGTGKVIVAGALSKGNQGDILLESGGTLQIGMNGTDGFLDTGLTNNGTLVFDVTGELTHYNAIDGTGAVKKTGTGTLTFNGDSNTYSGATTIEAGTLQLASLFSSTTSAISVLANGTLAGSGTAGDVTVLANGTINPTTVNPVGRGANNPEIATLTVGNLTLSSGAIYNWQTTSNGTSGTAGTDWDLISAAGMLTLNATSGSPITISLTALDGATLEGVKKASWEIGNFTAGVGNFSRSSFSINSANMTGTDGRYYMSLGSGNTTLVLNYKTAATWITGSGNWTTATNWDGESVPVDGDEVEFVGVGGTSTNDFASSNLSNISGFTFVEGAGAYTVNGNTLEIGGDGIVNSSTEHQTIGMNLTAGEVLVVDAINGSIEISGVVSGASALSKTGSEALILTANNTYTGGTTISEGMLAIGGETGAVAGNITVEAGATFAVERTNNATITNLISGSGSFAQLGTGVTSIIGNNTYAGGTSIIYGTLWAKSAGALGNGSTTVGQNFAQMSTSSIPSTSPALLVSSTQEMGGNLLVGGDLNWYDGKIAFYDTGTSPASGDLTINVGGNFFVSTSTGNATFDFSAVEALDAGVYTLINATSILADGTNFVAAHGQYTKLFGNFTTTNNTVVYTVTGAESGGPDIQNNGGPNTPVIAVFDVTQPTQTIGANNTVNALNFTSNAPLSIQNDGQLTLTSGNLNVLTGNSVISGGALNTSGNLTKLGSGELVLQSNTNVNGTASVVGGVLSVNGNLTANSVSVDSAATFLIGANGVLNNGTFSKFITNNGSFVFAATNNQTLSGTITGTGNLTLNSAGTLILSGSNSYAGGTTMNNGTLVIANTSGLGTGAVSQTSGQSLLVINTTGNIQNNLSIYNVSALQNATLSGLITVNNASWDVAPGVTLTVPNAINGTGGVTKNGFGNLALLGNNTYTGPTTINAGVLFLNGSLAGSTVSIAPGGTLAGNGSITSSANVTISGELNPGVDSIGTLRMETPNLDLREASSTVIQIASVSSLDQVAVVGQISLGGDLRILESGKVNPAYGQRYEILTATGGITGNFSAINMPGTFANSRGRFLINGTTGTLLIAPLSYVPLALNQNQRNVAAALDSFILANGGDRQTVSIALDSLTAAQYPAAFDAIMPGFYETLGDMVIEQAYNQTQLLNQRLSSVRLGATGFQAIGMSQPLKYDIDGDSVAEASTLDFVSAARGENGIWTPARIGRMAGSAPTAPAPYAPLGTNWNSWVMGIGEFAMSRGLSGVPNYNNNAGGFLAGADYRFGPTLSAGVYAGYQYNYAKYDNGSSTQGNSALFGLYASYANEGGYYADAVIGGGYTGFQTRRSIEFPGIDRTATADPGSGQFSAALNLGKDFQVGKFTLGPIVGAQYTYAGIGSFTESGADSLNLSLDQQNVNSLRTNLGARLAYNLEVSESIVLIPEVRGFWMHEFLNNPANITSSLNGGAGPSFDYETETPYRDSIFGGVGVSAKLGERWSASAFYNVNFGAAGYTNNIISTTLGFSF